MEATAQLPRPTTHLVLAFLEGPTAQLPLPVQWRWAPKAVLVPAEIQVPRASKVHRELLIQVVRGAILVSTATSLVTLPVAVKAVEVVMSLVVTLLTGPAVLADTTAPVRAVSLVLFPLPFLTAPLEEATVRAEQTAVVLVQTRCLGVVSVQVASASAPIAPPV